MDFCNDYHFLEGLRIAKFIITVLKIVIPILLVGFGTYDFVQTVIDPDKHTTTNQAKSFAMRLASAFLIFMLPTIISIIFSLLSNVSSHLKEIEDCFGNATTEYIGILKTAEKERLKLLEEKSKVYTSRYDGSKYKAGNYGELLKVAADLWKKIANGDYHYSMSGQSIPIEGNLIDCSSYISWVLYEYGFEDFKGAQYSTLTFLDTNFNDKYGWEEIPVAAGEDVTSKLKPGDILVRDDGGGGSGGHINITVDVKDGKVMAFDCGKEDVWRNSGGNSVDKTSFAKDSRPGKIIRVNTQPAGGSSSSSISKGDGSILLIAGHTFPPYCEKFENECRGKYSSGYDEPEQTRILVKLIKSELDSLGVKSDIANALMSGDNNQMNKSFYTELMGDTAEFKKYDWKKYKYAIEIHFNASETHNVSGPRVLLADGASSIPIDNAIINVLTSKLGTSGNAYNQSTHDGTYFKSIGVPFTYLETEFYDNKSAMDKYFSNKEAIAKEIASAIKQYYG